MTRIASGTTIQRLRHSLQWRAAAVLVALLVTPAFATVATAKRVQAPGSRISMDLPEKFKTSPLFAGFMEIISSAAIITLELPADAYDRVTAGFTAKALAKKGITDFKAGKLDRSDKYLFITGEQKHPRAVFAKFILAIKDAQNTAVLTFNVPKGSLVNGSIKRETVIKALTSAKLEAKRAPSRDLFKLGHTGPFVLTGTPTGTTRIYGEKGATGPKDTQNILVIAPSLNRLPIKSIKDFSQYALNSLKSVTGLKVSGTKDLRIDSMSGHEITATGTRGTSKTPVTVRQLVLLPANGGYFRLLTVTKSSDEQRLAPEIEKIFASFKATEAMLAQ